MKLELKHLAPYLPYGLKIDKVKGFEGIRIMTGSENSSEEVNIDAVVRMKYKPILKSMQDITEEDLHRLFVHAFGEKIEEKLKEEDKPRIGHEHYYYGIYAIYRELELMSFKTVEFMLKNHYDIFDLIPKGLAIDMKTLQDDK